MTTLHPDIPTDVHAEILARLARAEQEHGVTIAFACESGSRAWGFPSPDSDYDVRFLYVRPAEWYLGFDVERRRDVIEYPIVDEIDCNGWDLRKALYLFTRTNGALFEWLHSPIRYLERGSLAERLRALAPRHMNTVALCYHYSHMARTNTRDSIRGDTVKLKKYFYVLRPLLAIRYIEQGLGVPPVEFQRLLEAVAPAEIVPIVDELLERKRATPELGEGPAIPEINAFLHAENERHGGDYRGTGRPDLLDSDAVRAELNDVFRAVVAEFGGDARGA